MKVIFTLLLVFSLNVVNAQFEYFTVYSENYTFYPLEGLGDQIGMNGKTVAFGFNTAEDSLVMVVLDETKHALVIGYVANEWFNSAKMYEPEWKNDTVFIGSEMPYRATQNTFEFVWNRKAQGFFATEGHSYDPSWEAVAKADSMLKAENIRGAINWYYQVMYPQTYMNEGETGINLMSLGHKKAIEFYKAKEYDSAVLYMDIAFDFYPNSNYISFESKAAFDELMNDEAGWHQTWNMDKLKLWLGDYGLFLYNAKKYKESIEFNSYLNMILPDMAGPCLQLGDSYYDSGDKINAKAAYKKYTELKKKQGKEKDIPKRVKERSK
jgi:hypothetical protein